MLVLGPSLHAGGLVSPTRVERPARRNLPFSGVRQARSDHGVRPWGSAGRVGV